MRCAYVLKSGRRASVKATVLAAITWGSGPPSTSGQPRSTWSFKSSLHKTSPPRGPRKVLWVVVVTIWAWGIGSNSPLKNLARDQPGEVGHVDHQQGAGAVGDLCASGRS